MQPLPRPAGKPKGVGDSYKWGLEILFLPGRGLVNRLNFIC